MELVHATLCCPAPV